MEYEIDRVVKKCEETMAKLKETEDHLKDAESILNKCLELCKSYFINDFRTEASTMRYNTIITLINEYNEKKGETDENRGLQSKSS